MRGLPPGVELRRVPVGDRAALEALAAVQDAVYPDDPVDVDVVEGILGKVPWSFDVAARRDGTTIAWGQCRPRVINLDSPTAFGRLVVLPPERTSRASAAPCSPSWPGLRRSGARPTCCSP